MNDPKDFDPIAASLQRQFAPPPLDGLADRIAAAAAETEAREKATAQPEPRRNVGGWVLGIAVGLAAAAAALLALAPDDTSPSPPDTPTRPLVARASTPPQHAGQQLDTFLRAGAALPGDDGSCAVAPPPPSCAFEDEPQLVADGSVVQLGECGGTSGISCADFDLPADRALVVQLMPSGVRAIVCIEHPWTDPHPELPEGSGHNIFRSELGDYVIYEVSPLDRPQATASLRL